MMDALQNLHILFRPLDALAVALLLGAHLALSWLIERAGGGRPSSQRLMAAYRRRWHAELVRRENRIPDVQLVASLRQGASFFASTALIALGGGAALLGQAERLRDVAGDLGAARSVPTAVWEIKILLVLLVLAAAFFKFLWAIRIYGYSATLMLAIPVASTGGAADEGDGPRLAAQAAELNILADRSFARGLRGIYFTLAATAWFAGPLALIAATLVVVGYLWRQEFLSDTRAVLVEPDRPA